MHCIGTACWNHARSIISVLPNTVTVPQLSYNAISITFSHTLQYGDEVCVDIILEKLIYLDIQLTMWNCSFSVQSASAVKFVTMHILLYSGHVEYDIKTMTSRVQNTTGPCHRGPLEHNLQPGHINSWWSRQDGVANQQWRMYCCPMVCTHL